MRLKCLQLPTSPTTENLWSLLAHTRRLRRLIQSWDGGVILDCFGIPESELTACVKEFRDHEAFVMEKLKARGETV